MGWAVFQPSSLAGVECGALSPSNSRDVIISVEHQGVILRSTDRGSGWTEVFRHPGVDASNPLNRHGFKAIAYAPSDPKIVYAGISRERRSIDGDSPPGASFGMYKSTDGGQTWVEINRGLKTSLININCIAVDPADPNSVYIGTWKDGVFKTTDGGQSWALKKSGLVSTDVRSLAIDLESPEVVYAGLGGGAGIFKTTNGGELWEEACKGPNLQCPSYLLPIGGGAQGFSLEPPPKRSAGNDYYSVPWTSIWSIVIDPTDTQKLYAADRQSGVYLSTDGGANWIPINEGLSTRAVTAMAISSDGKVLYAATEGEGVFRIGTVTAVDPDDGHGGGGGGCFINSEASEINEWPVDGCFIFLSRGVATRYKRSRSDSGKHSR